MSPEDAVKQMLPFAKAILPPFASKIELAILAAELGRISLIDPDIVRTIWDPWKCPDILLPFLAQAVSVDVWSNDWSEDQKRRVIAASPDVHRFKGTRGAVERALKSFELDAKIVEWWEDDSRRGTFRVEMLYYNDGPVFDLELQKYAIQSVMAAKPKTRVFDTRAIISARAELRNGAMMRANFLAVAHPLSFSGSIVRAANYDAVATANFISVTAHPRG